MPFGKWKGVSIKAIGATAGGKRYLQWVRDNIELRPDLRGAIDRYLGGPQS